MPDQPQTTTADYADPKTVAFRKACLEFQQACCRLEMAQRDVEAARRECDRLVTELVYERRPS